MRLSIFIFLLFCFGNSFSQSAPKPRKSPLAIANFKSDKTYIKAIYSQPLKNEREIFGGIVPYGKIWRTGANEATEITFTHKVKINGKTLPAGTYSIFTIPNLNNWTVIFNSDLGMWGDYDYNSKNDILRVEAQSKKIDTIWEAFTIKIDKVSSGALMQLIWDNTIVSIPIEIIK